MIYSKQNRIELYKITASKIKQLFIKIFSQMTLSYNSFWSNFYKGRVRRHGYCGNGYRSFESRIIHLELEFTIILPIILVKNTVENVAWNFQKAADKVKVKFSMAKSLPVENLLPQNVGSIINYLQ